MGLFLYPDQPVLTAAVFDLVRREVSATGLGVVSFAGVLMATASPLIAGALYGTAGFAATAYYIASRFAIAAIVFLLLPVSQGPGHQPE